MKSNQVPKLRTEEAGDTQARNKIIKDFVMSLEFEHLTFEGGRGGGGGMDDLVWVRIQQQKKWVKSSTYKKAKRII